jgi:NADPH-dependent glutamate synthase beta subunit-like oxidoreductase
MAPSRVDEASQASLSPLTLTHDTPVLQTNNGIVADPTADEPYKISDHTLHTPGNRKLRISMIGAGVSGIMMAYKLSKHFQNYDLKIFERNSDIGGEHRCSSLDPR